jgi:RNA polymerase sigma-70 factor, ECF subfamily
MDPGSEETVNNLLAAVRRGDASARNDLTQAVYPELKRIARILMAGERKGHTLGSTGSALVSLLWERLLAPKEATAPDTLVEVQDVQHLLRVSAKNMRQILVDYARSHRSIKRGSGDAKVDIADVAEPGGEDRFMHVDTLTVDELLSRLAESHPERAQAMELKYFLELTNEEGAAAMGIPLINFRRQCKFAEAWMLTQLGVTAPGQTNPAPTS